MLAIFTIFGFLFSCSVKGKVSMSLNCVTNPVGQNSIMPQMQPIQPTVPCTIKIDIVPNYPMAQAPYAQPNVIYNMPQTSLYEPKTSDNIVIENNNISEQTEKPIFNILDIPDEENEINNTEKEEAKSEQEFIPAEIQQEATDYIENEREKKPNKYQILKERARQKKLAAQSNINQKV